MLAVMLIAFDFARERSPFTFTGLDTLIIISDGFDLQTLLRPLSGARGFFGIDGPKDGFSFAIIFRL